MNVFASYPTDISDSTQQEEAASNSLLPNDNGESVQEKGHEPALSDLTVEPPPLNSYNGSTIPSESVALRDSTNEEPSQTPSSAQQTPVQDRQREHTLFTPDRIRSAVAASENTRMFCSVAAAVLVIASFVGVPIVGLRGIMLFRPFYLLLLTNMTVVLGRLIVGGRGVESRTRRRSYAGGNDLADQLGRALELGLLMQKIVGAVSMDFSIYAVVLVFGLSAVQILG